MSKTANRLPHDEQCFTVALYGVNVDDGATLSVIGDTIAFLRTSGHRLSHLNVSAPGFGNRFLLFDRAWNRLQKTNPDDITSVGLYAFVDDYESQLRDWTATCEFMSDHSHLHIGAGLTRMPDAAEQLLAFTRRRLLANLRPAYGIGYFRKRGLGPGLYALALSYGINAYDGPEYETSLAICRWADGMHEAVYDDGVMRDVYPYNLLTARHLGRDVRGRPLRAWIAARPSRGALTRWRRGITLWAVQPRHIPTIRRELARAGALYCPEPAETVTRG